jgi:hypothetical protein
MPAACTPDVRPLVHERAGVQVASDAAERAIAERGGRPVGGMSVVVGEQP